MSFQFYLQNIELSDYSLGLPWRIKENISVIPTVWLSHIGVVLMLLVLGVV